MWLVLALVGCSGEEIGEIGGVVLVGPGLFGPALTSGTVTILDETGAVFDEAELDGNGRFEATAPAGKRIHAVVDGPSMVPAGFTGTMGLGRFEVPPGLLFAWPEAERDALADTWGGCAADGPVVLGEIRLFGVTDDDGTSPVVTTGYASVRSGGSELPACYLGESGAGDPEAEVTGDAGAFAVFGVQPGIVQLDYGYVVSGSTTVDADLELYVPEGGVTPLYPAWVDLFL